MQRVASTTYGSAIAPVGQALIQSEQVPQRSEPGTSGGSASVVRISPNNNQEPCSDDTSCECFPLLLGPVRCDQAFAMIGPVSTYHFVIAPGVNSCIFFSRIAN